MTQGEDKKMGVYTMTDNPMGLRLSPRLERILKDTQEGNMPSKKDVEFLIDESARFETIASRLKDGNYEIKDTVLDDVYDLKEVVKDLMIELENIYAHNIQKGNVYVYELPQFNPHTEYNIEKTHPSNIEQEVRQALLLVKDLQQSFTNNGDELEVQAQFIHLKKIYGLDLIVTAKMTVADIVPVIMDTVLTCIEKEAKEKQEAVERLKRVNK